MGLGFVLLVWAIVGTFLAMAAGAVLALIACLVQRFYGSVRKRWIFAFGMMPFLCGLYCFMAFIAYGIWSETYRGVDFGIGDDFHFPIANGYLFRAIDTMDNAWLEAPDGQQIHEGFQAIDAVPPLIFLEQAPSQFIVIDTATRAEKIFRTKFEIEQAAQSRGIGDVNLRSPDDFYRRWRFGRLDLIAATGIVLPPTIAFLVLVFAFWRSLRSPQLARTP